MFPEYAEIFVAGFYNEDVIEQVMECNSCHFFAVLRAILRSGFLWDFCR